MWKGPLYAYIFYSVRVERPGEKNGVGDVPEMARRRERGVALAARPCPARLSLATRAGQLCIRYST